MKVLIRIAVAVLVVLFVAGSLSYGQSASVQHFTEGLDYGAQGKFERAKEEFGKVSKDDARVYLAVEDILRVLEDISINMINSETAIHIFKGAAYVIKGQFDQAISDYSKAIALDPTDATTYVLRGWTHLVNNHYDDAISDYTEAIALDPRHAYAYFRRGHACYIRDQDTAISDFSKAIEIDPRHANAYYLRGFAYYEKGEYDKAWEDTHKAQDLRYLVDPRFLKALREASGRQE